MSFVIGTLGFHNTKEKLFQNNFYQYQFHKKKNEVRVLKYIIIGHILVLTVFIYCP